MSTQPRRRKVTRSSPDGETKPRVQANARREKGKEKEFPRLEVQTFWRAFALVVTVSVYLVLVTDTPEVKKFRVLRNIESLEHQHAYNMMYRRKGMAFRSGTEMDQVDYLSSASYGDGVTKCSLTVVLLDPRLPSETPGQPIWFALESIALHVGDDACFLLQTSVGKMKGENGVFQHIYHRSLPEFRRAIEQTRVRVTFLNHTKYHMDSTDKFNVNAAFLNIHYWKDEFNEADSDLILMMQADTVLCRDLDLARYRSYAWVGAVWPPNATANFPDPMEGMCRSMPAWWKSWLEPQRKWEEQQADIAEGKQLDSSLLPEPQELLNLTFPHICEKGVAPIGNGGLSLRCRAWMIKAIRSCPHSRFSGIEDLDTIGCKVIDIDNEDYYFGTILRGMGAPIPNAYEASLFSSSLLWPEEVLELYYEGIVDDAEAVKISFGGRQLSIPIGFHKPWFYQSYDLLSMDSFDDACPLMRYIFEA